MHTLILCSKCDLIVEWNQTIALVSIAYQWL
jgi:hypothetical protein